MLRTSIDLINGFTLEKTPKKKAIACRNNTDADSEDELALREKAPNQAKFLLHSQKMVAKGIDLYIAANETEFTYFR